MSIKVGFIYIFAMNKSMMAKKKTAAILAALLVCDDKEQKKKKKQRKVVQRLIFKIKSVFSHEVIARIIWKWAKRL